MILRLPLGSPPRVLAMCASALHGARGPERYRIGVWCLNLYQGSGTLVLGGERLPINPGSASLTPPDTDLVYEYDGPATLTWVHFTPNGHDLRMEVPPMQHLGEDFPALQAGLAQACVDLGSQAARATAVVWSLLWRLAPSGAVAIHPAHPLLQQAQDFIEQHLVHALDPGSLARRFGVSPSHLNRLFRQRLGDPVMAYVRRRRVARAVHLLRYTTMPINRVAESVGIPDPHLFNKTIRRCAGRAPREIRTG